MIFFRKSVFFVVALSSIAICAQAATVNPISLSNYVFSGKGESRFVAKVLSPFKASKIRLTGATAKSFRVSNDSIFVTSGGLRQILNDKVLVLNLLIKTNGQSRQKCTYTILLDEFSKNKVIAHRGAWKKDALPANSMAAFKGALKQQFAGSEFDVHLTADNVLVINHDPDFEGLSIEKSTYNQLLQKQLPNGEKIPTLEAFLTEGTRQTHTKLILEIKPSVISSERSSKLTDRVLAMVRKMRAQAWVNYISFDYNILKQVLRTEPSASVAFLGGRYSPEQLKKDGITGADYYYSEYQTHEKWIENAHKLGLNINAWTVNDPEIMKWLLINDADYITTNEPDQLLELERELSKNDEWKLAWSDEFNYTGLPDSLKWSYDTGGHGWGNNEKQYYTNADTSNVQVKNGVLSVIVRKQKKELNEYTSARLTTKDTYSFKYGRIDIRAKFPGGRGLWPAIWMLPTDSKYGTWPNSGEIDIVENVGFQADTIFGSIHTKSFNHLQNTQKSTALPVPGLYESYHVFRVDWQPESLDFYVDDKKYMSVANSRTGFAEWPFDERFYLLINVAVGGNWGGKKGIDNAIFPVLMDIDYVRIFNKQDKLNEM